MKTISRLLPIALTILLAAIVQGQTPTPPPLEQDVVRIDTTLIQIDATVTDKKGNPVTDLRPEEVELFENGKKQEITVFKFVSGGSAKPEKGANSKASGPEIPTAALQPGQVRRTIALVVDDLTMSFESTHFARRALRNFVANQMQDGDLVAIIRTSGGIGALQQFTSDKRLLNAAIDQVRFNLGGRGEYGAFAPIGRDGSSERPVNPADQIVNTEDDIDEFRDDAFATGTLGALGFIVRGMRSLPGRKSVMLMSDGFSVTRMNSRGFVESTRALDVLKRLVIEANRASVVVHTMDARGLQIGGLTASDNLGRLSFREIENALSTRKARLFSSQSGLILLASETGGTAVVNRNDLSDGIRRMLRDQSYYLIGYQPDGEVFDPEKRRFNEIEVKVKRSGVKVRHRSGFFGISDESVEESVRNESENSKFLNALASPFTVNDLNVSLHAVFKSAGAKKLGVACLIFVDLEGLVFKEEPNGDRKAEFDLVAMGIGGNGIPMHELSKFVSITLKPEEFKAIKDNGVVLTMDLDIEKPGAFQMRVAVRDRANKKVGTSTQFVRVPKLKNGRMALSGILVDNVSYALWRQEAAGEAANDGTDSEGKIDFTAQADTAIRRFRSGTVLKYALEAYNPAARPRIGTQLELRTRLHREGKVIYEGSPRRVAPQPGSDKSKVPIMGAINLATGLNPGDYVLEIEVTDLLYKKKKKRTVSRFVQFEIVE